MAARVAREAVGASTREELEAELAQLKARADVSKPGLEQLKERYDRWEAAEQGRAAVEAAAAYAKAVGEPSPDDDEDDDDDEDEDDGDMVEADVVAEADGIKLHLSSHNLTGYKGLQRRSNSFRESRWSDCGGSRQQGECSGSRFLPCEFYGNGCSW